MGVHDGHRKGMRKQFLESNPDFFRDHELLELLLFYSIPRRDTNPIAHNLINKFGSFADVFDAPISELRKIEGVGENTIALLKTIPQVARRYSIIKSNNNMVNILNSPEAVGKYLVPRFKTQRDEVVYAIYMDAKCKVLETKLMFHGSVNSANVNIRKIIETAITNNATKIVISHNHTSGLALPSKEDIITTKHIRQVLKSLEVELVDHIIVANDDFISMSQSGLLD